MSQLTQYLNRLSHHSYTHTYLPQNGPEHIKIYQAIIKQYKIKVKIATKKESSTAMENSNDSSTLCYSVHLKQHATI